MVGVALIYLTDSNQLAKIEFFFLFLLFPLIILFLQEIPKEIRELYKTVWEISQKTVLQQAADRGAFIDQSQSLNIHIAEPNYGKKVFKNFCYIWWILDVWCFIPPTVT